jgi:hypothetical protein
MGSNLGLADTMNKLDISQETSQLLSNVFAIQCRTMIRRIGVLCRQETCLDLEWVCRHLLAFDGTRLRLEHHANPTSAEHHARTALVKRTGGVFDGGSRSGGSESAESRSQPWKKSVTGSIIASHNDNSFGATRYEHILCHGNRLRKVITTNSRQ